MAEPLEEISEPLRQTVRSLAAAKLRRRLVGGRPEPIVPIGPARRLRRQLLERRGGLRALQPVQAREQPVHPREPAPGRGRDQPSQESQTNGRGARGRDVRGGHAPSRLHEGFERARQLAGTGARGGAGGRHAADQVGAVLDLGGQPAGEPQKAHADAGQDGQPRRAHADASAPRSLTEDEPLGVRLADSGQPRRHLRGKREVQVDMLAVQHEERRGIARPQPRRRGHGLEAVLEEGHHARPGEGRDGVGHHLPHVGAGETADARVPDLELRRGGGDGPRLQQENAVRAQGPLDVLRRSEQVLRPPGQGHDAGQVGRAQARAIGRLPGHLAAAVPHVAVGAHGP
jgi:hypothetical protein